MYLKTKICETNTNITTTIITGKAVLRPASGVGIKRATLLKPNGDPLKLN
jgi:hypothetical protein